MVTGVLLLAACGTEPVSESQDPCYESAHWQLTLDWTDGDCNEADLPRDDDFYVKQIVGGGIFLERPGEVQTLDLQSEAQGPYCQLLVTHRRADGLVMEFDLTTSDNQGLAGRVTVQAEDCASRGTVIGTRSP